MRKLLPMIAAAGLFLVTSTAAFASGGTTSVAVNSGSLSLTGAAPGTFSATLTGADQTVASALASYTAADNTGTGSGWNITFQATAFTCTAGNGQCPTGGDSLPTGSLTMAPPTVSCNSSCTGHGTPPSISIASNTTIDGSAVKIASAAVQHGMGSYTFTAGQLGGAGNALTLSVPGYAYATTYASTLTVSITSGP